MFYCSTLSAATSISIYGVFWGRHSQFKRKSKLFWFRQINEENFSHSKNSKSILWTYKVTHFLFASTEFSTIWVKRILENFFWFSFFPLSLSSYADDWPNATKSRSNVKPRKLSVQLYPNQIWKVHSCSASSENAFDLVNFLSHFIECSRS